MAECKNGVARKKFVAAQARKCHGNARFFGYFGHHKGVQSVAAGVVVGVYAVGYQLQKIVGRELDVVVLGVEFFGYKACVFGFAKRFFGKSNAKSLHLLLGYLAHKPHHGAAIYAAAQKCAKRHICHQPTLHRCQQQPVYVFFNFFVAFSVRFGAVIFGNIPVFFYFKAVFFQKQTMSRHQHIHVFHHGLGCVHGLMPQIIHQSQFV